MCVGQGGGPQAFPYGQDLTHLSQLVSISKSLPLSASSEYALNDNH